MIDNDNDPHSMKDSAPVDSIPKSRPYLLGIAGGSASGKTTVANMIFKFMGIEDCLLFSMDSYYKGPTDEERKHLSEYNFDHPNALDFDLLTVHLQTLLERKSINMPVYSFLISKREKHTTVVNPSNLIIFEGILSFHDKRLRDLMDMKIFVDSDPDIRLARRVYRDIKDRGRQLPSIIQRYHKFVKPAFEEYIKPTRKYADVIIPGDYNSLAIDLICKHLRFGLSCFYKAPENIATQPKRFILNPQDIIDTSYLQFKDNVMICQEKTQKILTSIFDDFIHGNKLPYHKMYLDYLMHLLLELFSPKKTDNFGKEELIINKEQASTAIVKEITEKNIKKIVLFRPIMLYPDDDNLLKILEISESLTSIEVIAIFLTRSSVTSYIEKANCSINFTTLYFSDNLTQYDKYLKTGGLLAVDGSDFTSELSVFTKENFIQYFNNLFLTHIEN